MPTPAKGYAAQSAETPLAPSLSSVATRKATMSRSTSSIVASATPTCTPRAASGRARSIRACRGTRSSAA